MNSTQSALKMSPDQEERLLLDSGSHQQFFEAIDENNMPAMSKDKETAHVMRRRFHKLAKQLGDTHGIYTATYLMTLQVDAPEIIAERRLELFASNISERIEHIQSLLRLLVKRENRFLQEIRIGVQQEIALWEFLLQEKHLKNEFQTYQKERPIYPLDAQYHDEIPEAEDFLFKSAQSLVRAKVANLTLADMW